MEKVKTSSRRSRGRDRMPDAVVHGENDTSARPWAESVRGGGEEKHLSLHSADGGSITARRNRVVGELHRRLVPQS